jgi:hypothetical protein
MIPRINLNGHWQFPNQMGESDFVGFIYLIKDTVRRKLYLGKKFYRTPNGVEGNWKYYTSSSTKFSQLIKEKNKVGFEFICLDQYRTKAGLAYAETWALCHVDAPLSPLWVNKRIEAIRWNVSERVSELTKKRLQHEVLVRNF